MAGSTQSASQRLAVSAGVDRAGLRAELERRLRGEVRFDDGSLGLYSTDASNYRQIPIGVVVPRDVGDVVEAVAVCRRFGAPLLPRGGGTSLAGQTCNVALVVDMSKYLREVIAVDAAQKTARVQPGTVLDDLRNAVERFQLTFGPDPATHNHCTLGGMIGNNSCGVHSIVAGRTAENVEELEILTYDGLRTRVGRTSDEELERIVRGGGRRGEIYARLRALRDRYADQIRERFPKIPRRVSGYGLDQLLPENGFHVARALVGTEGTCATVLEATVALVHSPPARTLLVLGYPDIAGACDQIDQLMAHRPVGLEGWDDRMVAAMKLHGKHVDDLRLLPNGGGWLLVEFGGETTQEARDGARGLMEELRRQARPPDMRLVEEKDEQERIWAVRESALGVLAIVPGKGNFWPGWDDSAVPPDKLGGYLRELRQLLDRYSYDASFYGHFGQGCLHTRVNFDFGDPKGIARFRSYMEDAADLVARYGGSLSGEHGDGQARAELLPKMFGRELVHAFDEFKAIWDPDNRMNPGKVVHPYRLDESLRLAAYHPPRPETHFQFPEDGGTFAQAALRCVGVGRCRREGGGTMCPSYMVTHEEEHSTRGRARLLFEMLQGETVRDGWRSEAVKGALDLCLACKGCKSDCPVGVDMATYKAEFLSHYYEGRRRPRSAHAFGLIMYWARLASHMPSLVNFTTQTPLLRELAKWMANISPERQIPAFAPETFSHWFKRRGARNVGGPRVILWPDTFNNHFFPEVAKAAVEVLEAAGWQVLTPKQWLCCGRPLYDYGMLDRAQSLLRQVLDSLRDEVAAGVPVVGLEPSCVSVFRDELTNLFPHDEDAIRLSRQVFVLSEFLERKAPDFRLPRLGRRALIQGHCHHKAIMKLEEEEAVLKQLDLDFALLDSGCCGMAGAFGFEKGDHYDVSIKAGERVLLPAIRNAAKDSLIIADGFSCREQIAQTTDRRALHLAQVIQMALSNDPAGPQGDYPEKNAVRSGERGHWSVRDWAAMAGAVVAAGALVWGMKQAGGRHDRS